MAKYVGKRVIITGGTSGIGLATARLMVSEGARVLLTGRTKKTLDAAREEFGENAVVVESDAASLSDIEKLAERVKTDFEPIDALFVNAGQTRFVPFEEMTEGAYDELFAVNAKGPYFTVQKLAPMMREGSGVVFTTSVVNVLGYPMVSAYAATKAAVRSMTRSLARELLPRGIRVNAVSPGPIQTSVLDQVMPKDALEKTYKQMAEDNPMKRVGNAEEIAKAVVFFAFEATYTTGAELPVDGGGSQL